MDYLVSIKCMSLCMCGVESYTTMTITQNYKQTYVQLIYAWTKRDHFYLKNRIVCTQTIAWVRKPKCFPPWPYRVIGNTTTLSWPERLFVRHFAQPYVPAQGRFSQLGYLLWQVYLLYWYPFYLLMLSLCCTPSGLNALIFIRGSTTQTQHEKIKWIPV